MEYAIITAKSSNDLAEKVNLKINQGWQPLGGIAIRDDLFAQAMTRPPMVRWTVTTTPLNSEPNAISLNETVKVDFR